MTPGNDPTPLSTNPVDIEYAVSIQDSEPDPAVRRVL